MNFNSLSDKRRKAEKYLNTLKTSEALERVAKQARKRTTTTAFQPAPTGPAKPKENLTEEDAYQDLANRLRPYMLNSTELTNFLELLKSRGALRSFSDLFGLFQKDYLTGVSRLTSKTLQGLAEAFQSRKLNPEPIPVIQGSGLKGHFVRR